MITPVRHARVSLLIDGRDYYPELAPDMLSFSYSDNLGQADDLQIELQDIERQWIKDSFPAKGSVTIDAAILPLHFPWPGAVQRLDCGTFQIDAISHKGPPNTVSIKGNSIPISVTAKGENKVRAWEGKTLRQIAEDISGANELEINWDTQENPRFKRIDQNDQTDLEFLDAQCKEAGLIIKIKRNQIKIFAEAEYEQRPPAFTLRYGSDEILGWSFDTKTADTAKESEVEFLDPETGKLTKAKAVDNDPKLKNARKIRSYDNPKSDPDLLPDPRAPFVSPGTLADPPPLADADYYDNRPDKNAGKGAGLQAKGTKKAKAALREANKHRDTAQFEVIGNPAAESGLTVALENWGAFDGIYFLEKVTHKTPPYLSSYSLHRELASKGY
jgi:phage protein D